MLDKIKKWWYREWSNWEEQEKSFSRSDWNYYIILKSTSNDGLIRFKKIKINVL